MIDDYQFLNEEEFEELDSEYKWNYVTSLVRIIEDLNIEANKNCGECEKVLITSHDINIDLLFEDWRECRKHCDECGQEERINMCETQLNIINHITNEINVIRQKQNRLTEMVLKSSKSGSKLLKRLEKNIRKEKKKKKELTGMFA